MRRKPVAAITAALVAIAAVLTLFAAPAFGECVWDASIRKFRCYKNGQWVIEGESPEDSGNVSTAQWPPPGYIPVRYLNVQDDGTFCAVTVWQPSEGPVSAEDVNQYDGGTRDPATYPPCPSEQQSSAVSPWIIAASYWEEIPLPGPRPHIAPGWAITGKLAYLETNGVRSQVYTRSTPFGPLEIVASGRYVVDWGDGEQTGPHSVEGKPWPDGEITHEYIWSGTYDIVVTERWTATWSLAGESGVLRSIETTGTIEDFPARQIQAVVR